MSTVTTIDTVAIIGDRGRMGRMLADLAASSGCAVTGADLPFGRDELATALDGVDMALLAVPAFAMADVVGRLDGLLDDGVILADICSVKTRPVAAMLEGYDGPVVGTHPLFGPAPAFGHPLRVAVTPGRDEAAALAVDEWLSRLGFTPFRTTCEDHDRAMAHIQGLNFVTSLAYLAASAGVAGVTEFVTPSFGRRLDSARKMITEDAELFRSLFDANPFSQEAVRGFRSLLDLAEAGNLESLVEKANWWWRNGHSGGGV